MLSGLMNHILIVKRSTTALLRLSSWQTFNNKCYQTWGGGISHLVEHPPYVYRLKALPQPIQVRVRPVVICCMSSPLSPPFPLCLCLYHKGPKSPWITKCKIYHFPPSWIESPSPFFYQASIIISKTNQIGMHMTITRTLLHPTAS